MGKLKIKTVSDSDLPILITTPGISPSSNIPFKIHKKQKSEKSSERFHIFGETSKFEYHGTSSEENVCQFAIGLINKESKSITMKVMPVVHLTQEIKSIQRAQIASKLAERTSTGDKRNLGQTFGTRKAKQAIQSYDRGQIDIQNLSTVATQIQSAIDQNAQHLSTPKQIEQQQEQNRQLAGVDGSAKKAPRRKPQRR